MGVAHPNLSELLWQTAGRHGGRAAVCAGGATISYEQLAGRAAAIADALRAARVAAGDRIAVFVDRGVEAVAAPFGVAAAGCITINVNETLRPRQIEHILEDAGVRILLSTAEMLGRLHRPLRAAASFIDLTTLPPSGTITAFPVSADHPAQIIYTSGSTGLPKGVVISHGNLWAVMHSVTGYLGLTEEDRIASLLPFSYTYGFNQLLCSIGTGAMLIIENSPMADQIVTQMRAQGTTVLAAVPPLWLQLLRVPAFSAEALPDLRVMTNAGGPIPTDAVRALRRAQPHARLFLMYGMTETLRATYLPPEDVDAHPNSIGRAIPGAEILVLREDGSSCDVDEVGELVQRGPTVGLGYWRDPDATARVFRTHPIESGGERVVYSGDLVRRDANGLLYHLGRRDRMVKTLGHRISPDEVVDVLFASGLVVEAVVTTEPDPHRGNRLIAHVVLEEGATTEGLGLYCRAELPRYMQPARIKAWPVLPRSASGKYDHDAIKRGEVAQPVEA